MLFVTFHGGNPANLDDASKGERDPQASLTPIHNIYACDDAGGEPGSQLFMSGGDEVMVAQLGKSPICITAAEGVDGKNASGMSFARHGNLFFVANRNVDCVCRYDVRHDGKFVNKERLIENMPDHPEFLLHVKD